jgi:hypothetical protein
MLLSDDAEISMTLATVFTATSRLIAGPRRPGR